MSEEFTIDLHIGPALRTFLYSQFFRTPRYPTQSFANQTVIVTGSNAGLGFEAARHFYRLNCARLILAVRTLSKGEAAKEDIIRSVAHRTDAHAIEVWPLDLTSTESVLTFAERVKKDLPRVDVLVESAGVNKKTWSVSEGFEQTIQAKFTESSPHLVVVTSEAHRLTSFPEINAPDLYEKLNDGKDYNGQKRYEVSKLLEVLFVRELVSRLDATKSTPPVIIDLVNPGLCVSNLGRQDIDQSLASRIAASIVYKILGHSTEQGSRTLVHGACAGPSSHGEYMSDGFNQDVAPWIYADVGKRVQKKVFEQTMKVLEARKPGVGQAAGL